MDRGGEDQNTCLVLILGFRTQYHPYGIYYWHAVWPPWAGLEYPVDGKWSELKGGQTGIPGAKWVGECLALHNGTSPLYRLLIISSAGVVVEEEEERKQHGFDGSHRYSGNRIQFLFSCTHNCSSRSVGRDVDRCEGIHYLLKSVSGAKHLTSLSLPNPISL